MGGQPVPSLPAHGCLLAVAFGAARGTKAVALARSDLETIRRTFVKITVRVEELNGRIKLAFPACYPHAAMLAVMTGAIATRGP
jgi:hypothetical protein